MKSVTELDIIGEDTVTDGHKKGSKEVSKGDNQEKLGKWIRTAEDFLLKFQNRKKGENSLSNNDLVANRYTLYIWICNSDRQWNSKETKSFEFLKCNECKGNMNPLRSRLHFHQYKAWYEHCLDLFETCPNYFYSNMGP